MPGGRAREMTDARMRRAGAVQAAVVAMRGGQLRPSGLRHGPQQARRGRAVPHGGARQHPHVPHAHLAVRRRRLRDEPHARQNSWDCLPAWLCGEAACLHAPLSGLHAAMLGCVAAYAGAQLHAQFVSCPFGSLTQRLFQPAECREQVCAAPTCLGIQEHGRVLSPPGDPTCSHAYLSIADGECLKQPRDQGLSRVFPMIAAAIIASADGQP